MVPPAIVLSLSYPIDRSLSSQAESANLGRSFVDQKNAAGRFIGEVYEPKGAIAVDDLNKRTKAQRNQEPETIDTTLTGNHPRGNYMTPQQPATELLPRVEATGLVWIEREDLRKQGMARKGDMKNAQAAPNRPHFGHTRGSGEIQ
jgi:hypothetical protein